MVCACLVLGGLISALVVALIVYLSRKHKYFQRRGIYTPPSTFALGHVADTVFKRKGIAEALKDIYTNIKENGHKFGGMYQFTKPVLLITDPELLRDVTVKYFDSFTDRASVTSEPADVLFSKSLLFMKGDDWRDMRHHLSPAFTGSKLRNMVELISNTGFQFTRFLVERTDYEKPLEMRDAFRRFATDVIATTAFGTPSNCVNNPASKFYEYGNVLMEPSGLRGLVILGYVLSPPLMKFLNIPFVPAKMTEFFTDIIEENIKYREDENKSRPDMIQLLIDARKANKKENEDLNKDEKDKETKKTISNTDIAAQAFTFFLGGFETVSTVLSFFTLELAINPEIQDRLRAEVDAAISRNDDKLTYEAIHDLKYMDMVVSEVLRKYPPTPLVNRVCTKSIDLSEYNLKVEKNTEVGIPFYGFHHDPEFFPEPERFDPERFSEANKANIIPFTYMPFGFGPRNCIGVRFALLEVKLCMAHILATTELHVCEKTRVPITLSTSSTQLAAEGGFWLTVRPRDFPSLVDPLTKISPIAVREP